MSHRWTNVCSCKSTTDQFLSRLLFFLTFSTFYYLALFLMHARRWCHAITYSFLFSSTVFTLTAFLLRQLVSRVCVLGVAYICHLATHSHEMNKEDRYLRLTFLFSKSAQTFFAALFFLRAVITMERQRVRKKKEKLRESDSISKLVELYRNFLVAFDFSAHSFTFKCN